MKAISALTLAGALFAGPAFAAETVYEQRETTTQSTTPAPSAQERSVIIEEQATMPQDPFPQQGADNPSGVLGQQDLNEESATGGAETQIAPGTPRTLENEPGELDPQEAPPAGSVIVR